ncbi:hypothetical protein M231_01605 [Tremella mesenterica]|uniref:PSP1 C-terminal domain-containing protein n=1 Tax=Tremella mesenterica TaxID=5217 RepID=A0A4Q1BT90_TREME|nr:uncharacterized protein TREMEDRAFT_64542 [Tremella mesenterica DSM 1558]EIW67295.1 hypothetical protein TREMEDRAFT_64542 [Tremella mesenterica DSM 1558]RXK41200.1 hypothetical protein M231_01605 [Tremella mesenterica]
MINTNPTSPKSSSFLAKSPNPTHPPSAPSPKDPPLSTKAYPNLTHLSLPSSSPTPHSAPILPSNLRPTPTRAASLQTTFKARAASQPAGERFPSPASNPLSGRGSPGVGANEYGVIGGSRNSGRFGLALGVGGTQTRANSFSVADPRDYGVGFARALSSHTEENPSFGSGSGSPYPTFSPSSSPAESSGNNRPPSPPRAEAHISRSRSQSLATGARPMLTRPPVANRDWFNKPFTSELRNSGAFSPAHFNPPESGSNVSPFARHMSTLGRESPGVQPLSSNRFAQSVTYGANWGPPTSALSSSVAKALQPAWPTTVGFDPSGGKSGSSSRRHSVSVVGGPGGRRDFGFEAMTNISAHPSRGLGPSGFSDEDLLLSERLGNALGNALSLEIDESRRRGVEIEAGRPHKTHTASSLPPVSLLNHNDDDHDFGPFSNRGRGGALQPAVDRGSSSSRSRFSFEPQVDSPIQALGTNFGRGVPPYGPLHASPDRSRDRNNQPMPTSPLGTQGPTGTGPINFDPHIFNPPQQGFGAIPAHTLRNAPPFIPSSPVNLGPPTYGRPPPMGFNYFPRPMPFPGPPAGFYPGAPPGPTSPTQPASPNFSSLNLSDLGRGIPLTNLPPTTALYIVTFKAGRRDVFYCPDPTLLISNGDWVIVEADRGSDLGTVVYDQLTPVDVREWQEKQATAALLSGAREHQPPGMAQAAGQGGLGIKMGSVGNHRSRPSGEIGGNDLENLLMGVGANGQLDLSNGNKGPLTREIMPKRIFTKSSQGPEEQARMMDKLKDEYEAMMICREKVQQRGMPMHIVDAEYQWDRRKLTFYFKADKRVDFRDLTKENFRVFKSRIWMSQVPRDDPRN